MSRTRIIVTAAGLLWLTHIGVTAALGTQSPGPLLSDAIQFSVGALLICALWDASRRSEGLARAFWNLGTAAYLVWMIAQGMSLYNDFAGNPAIMGITNLLFSFWFVPLAMALFLDPDHETGRLDTLMALDFGQGVLVCVAASLTSSSIFSMRLRMRIEDSISRKATWASKSWLMSSSPSGLPLAIAASTAALRALLEPRTYSYQTA